ncbi:hypothetical protein MTX26_36015 (plasmid) [Bradyrhizobium sp. ISRA443]|uniref:hypothetical protein n=1 Tax=unclassified Bradyrhizobium TaxID=2631580 RepID=UPI002479FD8C|nr:MULTISPECIES: hypothetical protein [unclassified Bradyrhizobium]WGR90827.1 hypothetical protein MTX20_00440 [Bradyrhizobium sp. ISRA435]WGS03041.1 hypothetical protein MTX23_36040 [Bradyrhizobium sp. ISRA436]WGS09925.1 hypothetical protein MTX18_36010 [Bradyrhizobium sp. ISRA437]WGS16810.1 hypothetical protein MTX26_36015 [Bradyrhizobium sp. ISRA443]
MRKIAIACIASGIVCAATNSAQAADGVRLCRDWSYDCIKWVIDNKKTVADKLKGYENCQRMLAAARSSGSFFVEARGTSVPCKP